jgi:hypothetical protein
MFFGEALPEEITWKEFYAFCMDVAKSKSRRGVEVQFVGL